MYVKTFPTFSYHVHTMSYLFLSPLRLLYLSLFAFFFHLLFAWLHRSPMSCSSRLCLCLLLSIPQSRIPGTVIPLCAAQCERIFNTTRIPGEETGKELNMYTHTQTHCANVRLHIVPISNKWTWAIIFNKPIPAPAVDILNVPEPSGLKAWDWKLCERHFVRVSFSWSKASVIQNPNTPALQSILSSLIRLLLPSRLSSGLLKMVFI